MIRADPLRILWNHLLSGLKRSKKPLACKGLMPDFHGKEQA
jgi:hypothetical protein